MIEGYDWAINRSKLERAVNEVKEKGEETEEAVKEVYVRLLGAIRGEKEIKAAKTARRLATRAKNATKKAFGKRK